MKRIMIVVGLTFTMVFAQGQEDLMRIDENKDSILNLIYERLDQISEKIESSERYKLYATENIYTLLKLDTKTGKIEQLQWSLDDDKEGTFTINSRDLSWNAHNGTFELYPTKNMYQFILLDKENGRTWHVQWGIGQSKRWIQQIY